MCRTINNSTMVFNEKLAMMEENKKGNGKLETGIKEGWFYR
jgi:hypothetical protein